MILSAAKVVALLWGSCLFAGTYSLHLNPPSSLSDGSISRRQALRDVSAALLVGSQLIPSSAGAQSTSNSIAAQSSSSKILLPRSNNVQLPRIGYSLYKTAAEQVSEGVGLALQAGTRHFDCASQYGTNAQVGSVIHKFLATGQVETKNGVTQTPRSDRQVYVTHKVSNTEQSLSSRELKTNLLEQSKILGKKLDLVMIHSPLTDSNKRLSTYATLCELAERKKIGAVGVCHFGVKPLQELVNAGLPAPSVIQLELSPFHLHKDVDAWAKEHDSLLSCAAWSRLSSTSGPTQGWDTLSKEIAMPRGITKQQVLIRWATQSNYLCVPRSNSQYKADRQTISENSWKSTKDIVLSAEEMAKLNSLNEDFPAGQLGVVDGWGADDILDSKWDPTTAIV